MQQNLFPLKRSEAYKYTDLSVLNARDLRAAPALEPSAFEGSFSSPALKAQLAYTRQQAQHLVLVNGSADVSNSAQLEKGIKIELCDAQNNSIAPVNASPVAALNAARAQSQLHIRVAKGQQISAPLYLLHLSCGAQASYPQIRLHLEEGAQLTIIEDFYGQGAYHVIGMMNVTLEQGACLKHHRNQHEDLEASHLFASTVMCAKDSLYQTWAFNQGAALMRHEVTASLNGQGSHVDLWGINIANASQHSDTATKIQHLVANTTSNELYKSVLDERAQVAFQGRIEVAKDAQQINGYQMSRALLLSDKARINTKPELEIYADDVVCSHGATVGSLNSEDLFYLRARGIPLQQARSLLIQGFLGEVFDNQPLEQQQRAMSKVRAWLGVEQA